VSKQKDMKLVGGLVSAEGGHVGRPLAGGVCASGPEALEELLGNADVFVDVTNPAAAERNVPQAIKAGVNVVVGTTGVPPSTIKAFEDMVKARGGSAVLTPNFSIGVNVFWKSCELLAKALPDYEVEIIELHHDKKKDAPSGTAKRAVEIISSVTGVEKVVNGREGMVGARGREIGVHAVRIGDVVGEHTVIFAGNKERIELTHKAHSREAFSEGSLLAVRWVAGRKDGRVHSMAEVLGL
jgi:4-hydroxy-tetrahydrodipicolinate reductase